MRKCHFSANFFLSSHFYTSLRIYGFCEPFWFLTLFSKIRKWFFTSAGKCQENLINIFQMSGRWFPSIPKGGMHPHKSRGIFSDIMDTASRLYTLYGLETLYVQSSRHVGITQKVLRHIWHFLKYLWCHQCQIFSSFCSFWLQQVSWSL